MPRRETVRKVIRELRVRSIPLLKAQLEAVEAQVKKLKAELLEAKKAKTMAYKLLEVEKAMSNRMRSLRKMPLATKNHSNA